MEDSRVDQAVVRRALERDPEVEWEVEVAETAEQALERLGRPPLPDVVLTDLRLPGMDGLELLQRVRLSQGGLRPAVVMLTGMGNEAAAVAAMKLGAQDYLAKDGLSPELLRHGLSSAVQAVRMAAELEERRLQALQAERVAREALTVRDELFALATHDLKGPLQNLMLLARLLRQQLPAEVLAGGAEARIGQILQAAERMGAIIDRFLEATRGGQLPLNTQPMDLRALVERKVGELAPLVATHPVRLHVQGEDFRGAWDPAALERVLDNLLGNAIKYSPMGGPVLVHLEEEPGAEGWLRLRVEDRGMGIPREELPLVFERFHRGRNARAVAGSGVGLASVMRLVQQHGGSLEVESEEGRGSTFIVRLPRQPPRESSQVV